MQCPAVSTQQLAMRTPPQVCPNGKLVFFGLTCRDTCQGIAPGATFKPPKIRVRVFFGSDFPQRKNCCGGAETGGVGGASVGPGVVRGASLGFSDGVGLVGVGLVTAVGLGSVGGVGGASAMGSATVGSTSVGTSPGHTYTRQ